VEIKVSLTKTFAIRSEEIYEKYKAICIRNGRKISDDLDAYMKDVVKNHETGNEQFLLTQWVDEADMQAVPAFFTENKKIRGYYVGQSDEELNKIEVKLQEYAAVLKKARMIKENSFDGKGHDENGNLINYP
jgi:hypothetical protein